MIDFEKLATLRDRHAHLHGEYQRAAEAARSATADAGRLRLEAAADPSDEKAAEILTMPPAALAEVPHDRLEAARIDPRMVRRVLDAHTRAARLRREAQVLADTLARSRALVTRLDAYAARFE